MKKRYLICAALVLTVSACGTGEHGDAGHVHSAGEAHEKAAASATDWCAEHAIAESACTKCDPSIIAKFKDAGDWCGEHGFLESHCPLCKGMESGHSHAPAATTTGETGPIRAD
jgi:cobalt-zinc-cadmium efflux system membrane fusion protein